jgi:hypothetical protein
MQGEGSGGGSGAAPCENCQDGSDDGTLVFRASPADTGGFHVSINCPKCGHSTRQIKSDVIKLIEGGKRTGEITRLLGCSDSYVRQIRRDAFPHDVVRRAIDSAYRRESVAP